MVAMFTRSSFAMKHAHPRASRHVYLQALAMIHVSAGIAGGWILSEQVANMRVDSGMQTDRRLFPPNVLLRVGVSGLLQYQLGCLA